MEVKKNNCCHFGEGKASSCRNKLTCSPCLIIWGAVVLAIIAYYLF